MGAAAAASGGASLVSVGGSALYVTGNSEKLTKTYASAGNRRTWTFSTWVYRGKLGTTQGILSADVGGGNWAEIRLHSTDYLWVYFQNAGDGNFQTSPLLRDIGWYHIVVALDTTQAIAENRCKIYINGERVTTFVAKTNPSLNLEQSINDDVAHNIGWTGSGSEYLDGYLAETVFIDGSQLAPTSFGAYDSSGLYWTPLSSTTIKALTFGDNGSYLDNTTNAQTDASGEGNNWTNNNTVTTIAHSPTNSYPIQNSLTLTNSYPSSLTEGNLKQTGSSSGSFASGTLATLPCDGGGKFYWEIKVLGTYTTNGYSSIGVAPMDLPRVDNVDGNGNFCLPGQQDYQGVSTTFNTGTTTNLRANSLGTNSNIGSAYAVSTGAFMQIAFDSATQKVWFGKDNTWYNSGDPANGTNPTVTLTATDKTWFPWIGTYTASDIFQLNYGATDFEYTPPTGFEKVSTTQLASDITRTASDTTKYFEPILYEGNGVGQRVGQFQPFTDSFTIAKSALFNVANEEYFSRTFATPTDQDVWTLSWWMKTGYIGSGIRGIMGGAASNSSLIYVTTANIYIYFNAGSAFVFDIDDPSQWQNIILTCNGTTLTCYWNGVSQGTASVTMGDFNSAVAHTIGSYNGDANWFDGYMADFIFVDGTVHSTSVFGQTDTSSGRWVPKDPTTTLDEASDFGNNGFFLNFANSSDMGNDVSGNNHDFTNNNTVTQSTDSPTTNWAVLNPSYDFSNGTFSNGNRNIVTGSSQYGPALGTLGVNSGKFYWEIKPTADTAGTLFCVIGISRGLNLSTTNNLGVQVGDYAYYSYGSGSSTGTLVTNTSGVGDTYGASYTIDDIMGVALDLDSKTLTFYKNNSSQGVITGLMDGMYYPAMGDWNNSGSTTFEVRFDSSLWSYSAPTGHSALSQDNITSSDQFITAFSWIKNRDATDNHMLFDRVRGVYKDIHSNAVDIEVTNLDTVQQFLAGGVQVGNDVEVNTANESYVLWNWMMEATGSGSSNEDGTINTTSTLVDTTLGMSIGTYSGTGSNATIGHGLGVVPECMIVKRLNGSTFSWQVYHSSVGNTKFLSLDNALTATTRSTVWNNTTPTSSVFSIGTDGGINASGGTYVAYCFNPSQFISIGSYVGNGNNNGTFIPTNNSLGIPIQPTWMLVKNISTTGAWGIFDTSRSPINQGNKNIYPNLTNAEDTGNGFDFLTGGFKNRLSSAFSNATNTFVYMAIGTPIIDTDGRIIAGR